ncbi:septation protein SepH [Nocardioides terrigena]|uniref:septation protein SepH n=1 Tax=Nocardioides terrigena TaxID=424797 RepID=UPI000D3119EE|nr:septation protein SepH [Nocardioides terrigena]
MAHLTLAGLSEDGKRLLLVGDNGDEYTLDADNALRAALRGEHARIGQLEITMDSALRPRDIQARIRAGESAESVAQAAQTTVERIMPFAAPVLAERAHVAQRAQLSSVRRRSGETGARTLGEAAAAQLRSVGTDPSAVEWDAWRREDGRWTLVGVFTAPKRAGTATFAFDVRGNFVTVEDDHARWLVGEQVSQPERAEKEPTSRDDLQHARQRRLSSVPADELPLGDDAIEMVHDGDAPAQAATETDDEAASDTETTMDLTEVAGLGAEQPVEAYLDEPGQKQSGTDEAGADKDAESPTTTDEPEKPAAEEDERPARRPARKGRGRASVPSWDEIMFGGGKSD